MTRRLPAFLARLVDRVAPRAPRGRGTRAPRPSVEALEPRLLYAADPLGAAATLAAAAEWRSVEPAPAEPVAVRTELVVVDAGVQGLDTLLAGWLATRAGEGVRHELLVVDDTQDGLVQVADRLQDRHDIAAVHVLAHGTPGGLLLGGRPVDAESLEAAADTLARWRGALTADADILVYGCDVAAGEVGQAFVQRLAELTSADVAASDDRTGAAARGGDWALEVRRGAVETQALSLPESAGWQGTLGSYVVSNLNDSGAGSLRAALLNANADGGSDAISFSVSGTIDLVSALPEIVTTVSIDGSVGGTPGVVLNGGGAVAVGLHLRAGSDGSTVRGLVIQGFTAQGIKVEDASHVTVAGNYIGTTGNGAAAAGNLVGIDLWNASHATIGGTSDADRNVISGNGNIGLNIVGGLSGSPDMDITVQGNYIGTTASGMGDLGNTWHGIYANHVSGLTIGGTAAGAGNLISGNGTGAGAHGITLQAEAQYNTVAGNRIGLNQTGQATLANTGAGILVFGSYNTIGGSSSAARNVISGNAMNGIRITGTAAVHNTVAGNHIGTNAAGTVDLGNLEDGIQLDSGASFNLVGGLTEGARNIVAGNDNAGVAVDDAASTGNQLLGNWIGLSSNGGAALGNQHNGINVNGATGTIIGNGSADGRNLVASSGLNGIGLSQATGTVIAGNWVVDNALDGVVLDGGTTSGNRIGGSDSASGNLIAYNGADGITLWPGVTSANAVSILANNIFANGARGIDLADNGYDTNDPGDADSGANGLQNYPLLASAVSSTAGTTVTGSLNSSANTSYRIDFYTNRPADLDGSHGEGARWLGTTTVTTDGSGNAIINHLLTEAWVNHGDRVTATATRDLGGGSWGGTSEYATNVVATASGVVVVDTLADTLDGTVSSITNLGSNRGADGRISLAEAMAAVNATANGATPDRIVFAIPPNIESGSYATAILPPTITLGTALTTMTQAVFIDARTQPGYAGTPLVQLRGNGSVASGIVLAAGSTGSTVRGLVIGNFTAAGIEITGGNTHTLAGNWVGLGTDGVTTDANGRGIVLANSTGTTIGGTDAADRNVISGNATEQLYLDGAVNSVIYGNYIGPDASGTLDVDGHTYTSGHSGLAITGASTGNQIGNTLAGARNVIAGNNWMGVDIVGSGAVNNTVSGNYIGTDASGQLALANAAGVGYWGAGTGNRTVANVIAGNVSAGVTVGNASTGATVQGNVIGLAADGSTPLGNATEGVVIYGASTGAVIGTDANGSNDAAEGNVISGNATGIAISDAGTTGTTITGNRIGTDLAGSLARGNAGVGIVVTGGASGVTIGGPTAVERNLISGNTGDGLWLDGVDVTVVGNVVGLDAAGTATLGNGGHGIVVSGSGAGVAILGNAIEGNAGLGIDLIGDGVTANDGAPDADGGPNGLQNFPVLVSARTDGSSQVLLEVSLASAPSTPYRIEFFADSAADASGHGEGRTFLGHAQVTTDAAGLAVFGIAMAASVPAGHVISATATRSTAGFASYTATSEFSSAITVTSAPLLGGAGLVAYAENQAATPVFPGLTVTDLDNATLASATVQIAGGYVAGEDLLAFTNAGMGNIAASWNAGTGTLTLSSAGATATLAQWQAALRAVTYANSADSPATAARLVSFTVHDGAQTSNTLTSTVTVTAVNDAPAVDLDGPGSMSVDGGQTRVNTTTLGDQGLQVSGGAVATDADGDYVVVWSGTGSGDAAGVFGQRYDHHGTPLGGEFRINTTVAGDQGEASVAMNAGGDFVVVWSGQGPGDNAGIFGQRFDSSGGAVGGEFRISSTDNPASEFVPSVAIDDSGAFVVVWQDSFWDNLYAQRFDAAGVAQGGEILVVAGEGSPFGPGVDVGMDGAGGFVVVWGSWGSGADDQGIYLRRYDAAGQALAAQQQVNQNSVWVQDDPSLAMRADGSFVVVWTSLWQDAEGTGVYGRRYDGNGLAQGNEFRVNTEQNDDQASASVALTADDGFVVTWVSGTPGSTSVQAQRFAADGSLLNDEITVRAADGTLAAGPSVAAGPGGAVVIVWDSEGQDGSGSGVYQQRFTLGEAVDRSVTFVEDGGAVLLADADAAIGDLDGGTLASLTVSLANLQDGAAESLSATTIGTAISASYHSGTGVLTLSGVDTLAHYQQVLRTVVYDNSAQSPGSTARVVTVVAHDGIASGPAATATVHVTPVNDAPLLDNTGTMALSGITEDQVSNSGNTVAEIIASAGGDRVTDADTGALEGLALRAASVVSGTGVWQYSLDAGTNWTDVGAVSNGSALLLRPGDRLRFVPDGSQPASASLGFRAWDQTEGIAGTRVGTAGSGGTSAFSSAIETATITVSAVADAPTLTGVEGSALSFVENGAPLPVTASLVLADADSATLAGATVQISSHYVPGEDLLAFGDQNGITGSWNAGTGVLTLSGSATVAQYQAALRSVTYANTSEAPSTATRTVSFVVNDGSGDSAAATRQVTVAAVNDAPVLSATGTGTAVAGQAYTLNLSATDADGVTITSWTISWGDGQIETLAGNPASATHTYAADLVGMGLSITVAATDAGGTWFGNRLYVPTWAGTDAVHIYQGQAGSFIGTMAPLSDGLDDHIEVIQGPNGNLYVSSQQSDSVLEYTTAGTLVRTFVAPGAGGLDGSAGMGFGPDGHLYVASYLGNQVLRYDGASGAFLGVAVATGTGGFGTPLGLNFGPDGQLYAASRDNNRIMRFDAQTGVQDTGFTSAAIGNLEDFAFGPDGHLYVADGNRIQRLNGSTGALIGTFVAAGAGGLSYAAGLAFGPDGRLYVADQNADAIRMYHGTTGAYLGDYVAAGGGGLDSPSFIGFAASHQVTVAAAVNDPPAFIGLDGTPSHGEGDPAVVLDGNVQVTDAELGVADDFNGATLTLARTGAASAQDVFSATGTLGALTQGGNLVLAGTTIGTVTTNSGGTLVLSFNGNATQTRVNQAMQQIAYANTSDAPPASVQMDWTFSDGNTGAQGSGGALAAAGSTTVTITAVNDAPVFGVGGTGTVVTAVSPGMDQMNAIALQADGRLVVAGPSTSGADGALAVLRYLPNGERDLGFGSGGQQLIAFPGGTDVLARDVAFQADGKIVVTGWTDDAGHYDLVLARLQADGSLDTSFGTAGIVRVDGSGGDDYGDALAIQADGRILVSGSTGIGSDLNPLLMRFLADGSVDTAFGTAGRVVTTIGTGWNIAYDVALQSDGRIVTAGLARIGGSQDVLLMRFLADGTPDSSFGSGGLVSADVGGVESVSRLLIQPDGAFVVVGSHDSAPAQQVLVMRFNAAGTPDAGFGTGGAVLLAAAEDDWGDAIALQGDGRLVIGGTSVVGGLLQGLAVRLMPDGTLDSSFGTAGRTLIDLPAGHDWLLGVALQPDGGMVFSGATEAGGDFDALLVRLDGDGRLDPSFGVTQGVGGDVAYTEGSSPVVLDADATIVDGELTAADNFDGATLTLRRAGGADAQDVFTATGTLDALTQGDNLVLGGITIGSVTTNSGGTLLLSFNGSATQARVDATLQQIAYANSSDAPPATVQIDWTFSDGNSGAQGTGGALLAAGSTTVNIASTNDAPTALIFSGTTTGAGSSAVYHASLDAYYVRVGTMLTWEAAMDNAQASFLGGVSGSLAVIDSVGEANFLFSLNGLSNFIGYADKLVEGAWMAYQGDTPTHLVWSGGPSGSAVDGSFTNFAVGQPNNVGTGESYAIFMGASAQTWNDVDGTLARGSFVEWTGAAYRAAQGVAGSVMENAVAGTLVGTLAATDADAGDTHVYSIVGGSSLFDVVGNELRVKAGASFDHEAARSHSLTVRVTDAGNNTLDQAVTIRVVNVNEAPTDTGVVGSTPLIGNGSFETHTAGWNLTGSVGRGIGAGASAGSFALHYGAGDSPNDGVATTTFSTIAGQSYAVSFDMAAFGTSSVQVLNLQVLGSTSLVDERLTDAATAPATFNSYRYTFTADSATTTLRFADASASTVGLDLALDNIQVFALATATPTISAAENLANGTIVGHVASMDPDAYSTVSYSLVDDAGGRFAINNRSGQITVADGSLLDFESATTHIITVRTTDQGGLTLDKNVAIDLTDANEAPTLGNGTLAAVNEDTAAPGGQTVSAIFSGQVADVDAGASLAGIAVIGNGADAGTEGAWQYSSNGGSTWFAIGSVADGPTAMTIGSSSLIRFVPVADFNGTPTALTVRGLDNSYAGGFSTTPGSQIRVTVDTSSSGDSTAIAGVAASLATSITAVDDAPVVTTTGTTLVFTESQPAAAIDPELTVSDVDSASLFGATVTISSGYRSGQDVLSFTDQLGITGNWDQPTGVLKLSGTATVADYQTALRWITYDNTNTYNPNTGTRTVRFVVNDGTSDSAAVTRSVSVASVNDGPAFSDLNGTSVHAEGGAAVVLDANVMVFDGEQSLANNFSGATLTLARNGGAAAEDALAFDGTNVTASGADVFVGGVQVGTFTATGGQLVVSFGANATQARVNQLLQNIVYGNTSDAPPASLQIDWTFDDGNTGAHGSGGALAATGSTTVGITAVNDAPTLGNGTLAAVNEDTAAPSGQSVSVIFIGAFVDADAGASLAGIAVVDNSAHAGSEGVWHYSSNGGTTWGAIGTVSDGVSALAIGSSSLIRFVPVSDFNGAPPALTVRGLDDSYAGGFSTTAGSEIRVTVDTAGNGGSTAIAAATATLGTTISAVNDAPVITINGGSSTAAVSAAETTTGLTTVTSTDVDGGTPVYGIVPVGSGGAADAARFTIDANTGVLSFVTAPNFEAPADADADNVYQLTVQVSDGAGGEARHSLAVVVGDVNEVPQLALPSGVEVMPYTAGGTAIARVTAVDPDAGDALVFSLLDDAGGRFAIEAATGVLRVADGGRIDRTQFLEFSVLVQVSDSRGAAQQRALRIGVLGLPDGGVGGVDGVPPSTVDTTVPGLPAEGSGPGLPGGGAVPATPGGAGAPGGTPATPTPGSGAEQGGSFGDGGSGGTAAPGAAASGSAAGEDTHGGAGTGAAGLPPAALEPATDGESSKVPGPSGGTVAAPAAETGGVDVVAPGSAGSRLAGLPMLVTLLSGQQELAAPVSLDLSPPGMTAVAAAVADMTQGLSSLIGRSWGLGSRAAGGSGETAIEDVFSGARSPAQGPGEQLLLAITQPERVAGVSLTAGFVWWLTRGGGMLATALLSVPAWRHMDLLPVTARADEEDDEEDAPDTESDEPTPSALAVDEQAQADEALLDELFDGGAAYQAARRLRNPTGRGD